MPQKGFIYLIDAVEELSRDKNISKRFKVVAVNNGAYIREYKTIIQEKGLTNYFIFFGFTPEIGKIIVELDAVIMPSLWEAFGLLAIEAFVLGCPLIASNCIGLREVINNTPAIVVEKGNASSIAEAIKKVLQNPSSVKQKSSEFISIARERFNSQKTADQLATLFNKLISSRNIKRS
jgi:glycosyltransferase involved in cell wall biosynthesis